ncbi:MAG: DUF2141 domain-containing protein [Flavobacteriales bacterium]|nr:DUF2141 domain-containing protein [Flavobacteriales bacterium]
MKTLLINLVFVLSISFSAQAQSEMYQQKMAETMKGYATAQKAEDYIELAGQFERIANVEEKEWLPLYYHAHCYILASFTDKEAEESAKDGYLDVAEGSINKMIELVPEESEVYALQSFLYTGRLVINPMQRAAQYSPLGSQAIEKSLQLNPKNPRAKYLRLSNEMGTAQFFGQDIQPYCDQASQLLAEWGDYVPASPLHPDWGKGQVESIISDCEKNTQEQQAESDSTQINNPTYSITMSIEKLPSDQGMVMIEILDKEEKTIKSLMSPVKDQKATITAGEFTEGTYSIRFYHDENGNQKMDSDKYGRPLEGYGYSNNAKGFMGPPEFEKTLFELKEDLTLSLISR